MAIPVGSPVVILPIQAAGCINFEGIVMDCCSKWSCIEGPTGQRIATADYLVRYNVRNCNECEVAETRFCESELQLIIPPPP